MLGLFKAHQGKEKVLPLTAAPFFVAEI